MDLRKFFPALVGAALLVMGGASMAADYRADEFLGLDLSKAVLSPKRLGPPAEFVPVQLEAKGDIAKSDATKNDTAKTDTAKTDTAKTDTAKTDTTKTDTTKTDTARTDTKTDAAKSDVATTGPAQPRSERRAMSHRGTAVGHVRVEKPRGAARTKLAHRNGNPLDAQARDTRNQAPRIQAPRIQTPRIQTWPCNSGGICNWKQ
jgi:hypothetical protein